MSKPKTVKYTYYDFHTETKGDNFDQLNNLIVKVEEKLVKTFAYYVEERGTGKPLLEQKGVMRTNCLDCLDRTNVVQNKLAFRIIETILDQIKDMNRRNNQGGMKAYQNNAS